MQLALRRANNSRKGGQWQDEDFDVFEAGTGAEGMEKAKAALYDLVILDVGLPDTDGRELCRRMRKAGVKCPVLMLTLDVPVQVGEDNAGAHGDLPGEVVNGSEGVQALDPLPPLPTVLPVNRNGHAFVTVAASATDRPHSDWMNPSISGSRPLTGVPWFTIPVSPRSTRKSPTVPARLAS